MQKPLESHLSLIEEVMCQYFSRFKDGRSEAPRSMVIDIGPALLKAKETVNEGDT